MNLGNHLSPSAVDAGIRWASTIVGEQITEHHPLTGGVTSTMVALSDAAGREFVLRLMTEEPWRAHGPALTRREQSAQQALAQTLVPAPITVGLDADGQHVGVSAHLMTRLPGRPAPNVGQHEAEEMAEMLTVVHHVKPAEPFRDFQSWAPPQKWVIPDWTKSPESWQRAFDVLAGPAPSFQPRFLHRDFSHRNLLWEDGSIRGLVDWVETSTGPAWLDAGHAATNLAVGYDTDVAGVFVDAFANATGTDPEPFWMLMDAVGFLPFPGKPPMFGSEKQLAGLDSWLQHVVKQHL